MFLRFIIILSIIIFYTSSFLGNVNATEATGLWTGTVTAYRDKIGSPLPFLDTFYQYSDSLFITGSFGCETNDEQWIEFKEISPKVFQLINPISCEVSGINIVFNDLTLKFSADSDSFTATGTMKANNIFIGLDIVGHKLSTSTYALNNPIAISGDEDSMAVYTINVPLGASELRVSTDGGWGDCDLYVFYSKPPFYRDFSEGESTSEQVSFSSPPSGQWYIVTYGYERYGGTSLRADVIQGEIKAPSIKVTVDDKRNESLTSNSPHYLKLSLSTGSYESVNVDWWLIMVGPFGEIWHYDIYSGNFQPNISCSYRSFLLDIPEVILPIENNLQPGNYHIYFGVDTLDDCVPTIEQLFYDHIEFKLE